MLRALRGLALFVALTSPALAGERLSLDQARRTAVYNHPTMQAAELEKMVAAQQIDVVRSDLLPQIRADALSTFPDGKFTRIGAPPDSINNPSVIEHASVGLGVQQMITDFGKTRDLVEAAQADLEAQRGRAAFTRDMVLVNVTRAYFSLLSAKALLLVAGNSLKARQTLLNQISALRKAQLKSDLDVSVAEQLVADANLFQLRAQSAVNDTNAQLAEALGSSRQVPFDLDEKVEVPAPPDNFGRLVREASASSPQLAALEAEREAMQKRAEAAGKAWYPTVSAVGLAGLTPFAESDQEMPSKYAVAGLTVSVPLFTGGRLAAEEEQAYGMEGIAKANLDAELDALIRDLRISFDNARTAYQNISVSEEALKNANQTLTLMQTGYKVGQNSIVDLSQAQLAQTQADIGKTDATYEYLIQLALLRFTLGNDPLEWEDSPVAR